MEPKLGQVYQEAVQAHRSGEIKDASRLYSAILRIEPTHPEANYNMGLLAVHEGKIQKALLFFKTALLVNSNIYEFWLSYIKALLKLNKKEEGKNALLQAKKIGIKGAAFERLEKQANKVQRADIKFDLNCYDGLENHDNIRDILKLGPAHRLAKKQFKEGSFAETKQIHQDIITRFPKNNISLGELRDLLDRFISETDRSKGLSQKQFQHLINLYAHGQFQDCLDQSQSLLKDFPNSLNLLNICGASHTALGRLSDAKKIYNKAINIEPKFSDAHNNLGNTLRRQGELEQAIKAYKKALIIKSDHIHAHNNLGSALNKQGKWNEAIKIYKKAISLQPDNVTSYYNMGFALQEHGEFKAAAAAYKKAIILKPNFAAAYNNLGAVLKEQGKIDKAIHAYSTALVIQPDNAELAWNLSGLAKDIIEAKAWITRCLQIDQNHLNAKLTLSALYFYEGNTSDFKKLMKSPLSSNPFMRSFAWVFNLPILPKLFFHRWALFDFVIGKSNKDRPIYEFGIWRGASFRYLIKTFKNGFGFDTFWGLPESWHGKKLGTYSSEGRVPKIKRGEFIIGKFQKTLPLFFAKARPMASIINFDSDLYSSTICALNNCKQVIDQDTILIFDEFLMNENWEQDEAKALNEFCKTNKFIYEVLAISFFTKQIALKLKQSN